MRDRAAQPAQGDGPESGGFGLALGSGGFRRLLIAQAASSLGDWVATFAFIVAAFSLTGSQTSVAVVLVLRLVPPMFAAPVGGVVADRLSRRRVMVAADLLRAALIAVAPFVDILLLYAIAFAHECVSLFFLPARDASVPDLVPRGALPEANALVLASSYGSLPIAAALFGGLRLLPARLPGGLPFAETLRSHPTSLAFLFDSATFLFSAAMLARLRLPHRTGRLNLDLFEGVGEGVRYVLRHPGLRALASGLVVSMFGGGVLFAVGIAYIRRTLGGSDVEFAWLASLWGGGMGLGLLAVRFLVKGRRDQVFVAAVAACGAILIVMGMLPVMALAFAVSVAFGMAFSVAVILGMTAAQEIAEEHVRGRIMGGVQMLFRIGLGCGALAIGALAQAVGRIHLGFVALDGNQIGLVVGGVFILAGGAAASGIRRSTA